MRQYQYANYLIMAPNKESARHLLQENGIFVSHDNQSSIKHTRTGKFYKWKIKNVEWEKNTPYILNGSPVNNL
jgi:hypothetical protein